MKTILVPFFLIQLLRWKGQVTIGLVTRDYKAVDFKVIYGCMYVCTNKCMYACMKCMNE